MSKFKRININVEKCIDGKINKKQITTIKKKFLLSKIKKFRILLHENYRSKIHEMLIFLKKDYEMPKHYNYNFDKSYFLIHGKFKLLFYNKKKKIINTINMDCNSNFFYRFKKKSFHKLTVESKYVVFLETSAGPFLGMKTL
jgi:cupin fold WbuC family metalloprotein